MLPDPEKWEKVAGEFLEKGKISLVIGPVDTGKTTFIKWFLNYLVEKGLKVALIDADIGQSTIGPPGTIGLSIVDSKVDNINELKPFTIDFVGTISPSGNLMNCIISLRNALDRALKFSADKIIIDTTGMIREAEGIFLKQSKIELLKPDFILYFSRNDELLPILSPFKKITAFTLRRLEINDEVKKKSPEFRGTERKRKFTSYFDKGKRLKFNFEHVCLSGIFFTFHNSKQLHSNELRWLSNKIDFPVEYGEKFSDMLVIDLPEICEIKNFQELKDHFAVNTIITVDPCGCLTGLMDEKNETLFMGIITDFRPKNKFIEIFVPPDINADPVKRIHTGKYKLPEELFSEIAGY